MDKCDIPSCEQEGTREVAGGRYCEEHFADFVWQGRNPARMPKPEGEQ